MMIKTEDKTHTTEGTGELPRAERIRVINVSKGTTLATASRKVTGPVERGIGLIGRKGLEPGSGLIIKPCNSVVSFFMRFTIDVVFVGDGGEVLFVLHEMVTWRTSRIVRGSRYVVELPAGTAKATNTAIGDRLELSAA